MTLLLVFTLPSYAQFDNPDEDEDGEDAPLDPAPIDDYLVPMLLLGVATGYYLIRKKNKMIKEIT